MKAEGPDPLCLIHNNVHNECAMPVNIYLERLDTGNLKANIYEMYVAVVPFTGIVGAFFFIFFIFGAFCYSS